VDSGWGLSSPLSQPVQRRDDDAAAGPRCGWLPDRRTEAHYFFRYDGVGGTVSVNGDDDLWVFINGQLAIDLGAPHVRTEQTASINASYGLSAGHVYDLALFHADRHPRDSNFELSLPDFGTMRSVCQPQ
jgi:fibro-slime domain-containing protein